MTAMRDGAARTLTDADVEAIAEAVERRMGRRKPANSAPVLTEERRASVIAKVRKNAKRLGVR